MTYLELCKQLRQEAEIPGEGPATVIGQTGQLKQVVDWINQANRQIQNMHDSWKFMWTTVSKTLTISVRDYDIAADFGISDWDRFDFKSFFIYKVSDGIETETQMDYVPYPVWREAYSAGSSGTSPTYPKKFTILPDETFRLDSFPDAADYSIRFDYYRTAQTMTADADESYIPAALHDVIVAQALEYYANTNDAPEVFRRAIRWYNNTIRPLKRRYLPQIQMPKPLAG